MRNSAICQSKPHSSEPVRRNALAGLRQRRQANSSAKRWITFARASTARDRRNRRSRSGCRRRAKRASIFPRRRRGRHPNALVAQRNEPCAKGAAAARRRLHRVRGPRVTRSSERVTRLPRRRRSRDRRAAARASVRRRQDMHRPGRRRGRRDPPFAVRPPSVPLPRVDAGRKPDKTGGKRPGSSSAQDVLQGQPCVGADTGPSRRSSVRRRKSRRVKVPIRPSSSGIDYWQRPSWCGLIRA